MTPHPVYENRKSDWRRYRLSYQGGQKYLQEYVFQHQKEPNDYYKDRVRRAHYPNHIKAVVDTYAAHLYRDGIPRSVEDGSDTLERFWSDMDLKGNEADEVYERAAQKVQVGSRVGIVVDRWDPDGGESITRAQQLESGVRPYAYLVDTTDIVDWDVDRRGGFNWVTIREKRDVSRSWNQPHPGQECQYRTWTDDEWILWVEEEDDDGDEQRRILDRGSHPVGEPPVVMAYWGYRDTEQPVAESAVKDLCGANIRLTNFVSLIDEQVYSHVFNILCAPQETYDALESIDFSSTGAIPFPDEASSAPHYIGPDTSQLKAIRDEVKKTEDQIRQLAGLGRVNEETKHVQSGIAMSYMTMDKDALLGKFGRRMAYAESKVDSIALRWMGEDPMQFSIERDYPSEFDPVDVQNEIDQSMKLTSMGLPKNSKAYAKNLIEAVRARFGERMDPDELREIEQDLRDTLEQSGQSQSDGAGSPLRGLA